MSAFCACCAEEMRITRIPCDRAYSMAANVLWLLWPSITTICGASFEAFVNTEKYSSHFTNRTASVQPFGLA